MNRTLKTVLIVVLVILTASSGALFLVAFSRPGTAYDPARIKIEVDVHTRNELLTSAYKMYGDHSQNMWVAKTIIRNNGSIPVHDFTISYKLGDFTDWTSGEYYQEIRPGQTVRDYCWPALDADRVRQITTRTPAELRVRYTYRGLDREMEEFKQVFLLGRNDFVFSSLDKKDQITFADMYDNYRFIASFVTPNEETTKQFANRVGSGLETAISDEDALEAFRRSFLLLREHGVRYIMEPDAFWAGSAAQYVQYPMETIDRRSGTCLDLAICISALMEAVGIRSYVAIIPGHAVPMIELPGSGDLYAIESTFIDQEYALTRFPGLTGPEVTPDECIDVAAEAVNDAESEGTRLVIDIRYWWSAGVVPPW